MSLPLFSHANFQKHVAATRGSLVEMKIEGVMNELQDIKYGYSKGKIALNKLLNSKKHKKT